MQPRVSNGEIVSPFSIPDSRPAPTRLHPRTTHYVGLIVAIRQHLTAGGRKSDLARQYNELRLAGFDDLKICELRTAAPQAQGVEATEREVSRILYDQEKALAS